MVELIIVGAVGGIIGFFLGSRYTKKTIERELLEVLEEHFGKLEDE